MLTLAEAKRAILRRQGNWHSGAHKVQDPWFQTHEFFDPHDLLQVKYEMLRRVRVEGMSISAAAARFGFSRVAFYQAQQTYEAHGWPGLIRRRPGPRRRHKVTPEVEAYLGQQRERLPTVSAATLTAQVQDVFGIRVHPRTVERVLAGSGKKTLSCRLPLEPSGRVPATSRGLSATRICAVRFCKTASVLRAAGVEAWSSATVC